MRLSVWLPRRRRVEAGKTGSLHSFRRRSSELSRAVIMDEMDRKRKCSYNPTDASFSRSPANVNGCVKREKLESPCIQYTDVTAASFRIRKGVKETPLKRSEPLSAMLGMNIFFKKEFMLPTGSFKERGARNTLELLTEEQKKKGVIAASAGNHALALAHHGKELSIPVVVLMPEVAPLMKVERCRQYGAEIIVHGRDIGEAKDRAMEMAREREMVYVNGYDDPNILAGQGTAALEVVSQMEKLGVNLDAVVIPVGGGGLLAGMAVTLKHFMPQVQVIGVESEQCASFSAALKAGEPVYTKALPTLADGLAVPVVGGNAFVCARECVDEMVVVQEKNIALAILRLVEIEKSVVEGAGATGLAACLSGQLNHLQGKNVVVMLCGGNIDTAILGRCLERGLAADGRMATFKVVIEDRPGSMSGLTQLLTDLKCSVKDVIHERTWLQASIHHVEIQCVVETVSKQHRRTLKTTLLDKYGDGLVEWGGQKFNQT